MDYIGTVPPKLWDTAIAIARKEKFPRKQPPDTPYVILKKISDSQLIALSGIFQKQAIDLFVLGISHPSLQNKDRVEIEDDVRLQARQDADNLLARAVHTSSISNQPVMNRK